jgi:hypothetical protein
MPTTSTPAPQRFFGAEQSLEPILERQRSALDVCTSGSLPSKAHIERCNVTLRFGWFRTKMYLIMAASAPPRTRLLICYAAADPSMFKMSIGDRMSHGRGRSINGEAAVARLISAPGQVWISPGYGDSL